MKRSLTIIALVLIVILGGMLVFKFYGYIFAKTVRGNISKVERVNQNTIITNSNTPTAQMFSFAVSIKDTEGEFHTASSEDRQWAVVQPGQCVEAKFYPYPPWQLDKSGTYHGARLIRLFECPSDLKPTETPAETPVAPTAEPTPTNS